MKEHHKKQVSTEVPFHFLNGLGHDTRAMERFFDLPRETQETLTDAVASADNPDARSAQAYKSLANGGEGYCDRF